MNAVTAPAEKLAHAEQPSAPTQRATREREEYVPERISADVGLSLLIGDGTYLNGKPFKYVG